MFSLFKEILQLQFIYHNITRLALLWWEFRCWSYPCLFRYSTNCNLVFMSSPYTYLVVVNAHYLHQSYGAQTTADVFYAFSGRTTYVHVQSRRRFLQQQTVIHNFYLYRSTFLVTTTRRFRNQPPAFAPLCHAARPRTYIITK